MTTVVAIVVSGGAAALLGLLLIVVLDRTVRGMPAEPEPSESEVGSVR